MIARVATLFEDHDPGEIRRWAIVGAVVVLLHFLVLWPYAYFYHPEEIGDDSTPISLDLSPSDDTVDQAEVLPTPEPPPQVEQPPPEQPPPPPPPQPQAIIEAPPPPPPKVEEQPPPTPPTPARTKGGAPHVTPTWVTAMTRRLEQYKRYPAKSRDRSEEGTVLLGFTVDRTGHVLAHEIVKTSGHPDLDAEASSMIERAQPLPAFPDNMTQDQLDLTVPVRFYLEH
jgi:periplasmic protein TonB